MMPLVWECLFIIVKSFVAAAVLFVLARLMGKKQIAQLTFFDYVVGISIGSVAAEMSVARGVSIHAGIVSMLTWAALPMAFAILGTHSMAVRRFMDGVPVVLIQNGKIIERNLRKSKFTINDLLEEFRQKEIFDIADVSFAVLETSGKISVLKAAARQPATVADLKLPPPAQGVFANVIIDGKLMRDNMRQMNITESWLMAELEKNHIHSAGEVLLATCDAGGALHIDRRGDDPQGLTVFQ